MNGNLSEENSDFLDRKYPESIVSSWCMHWPLDLACGRLTSVLRKDVMLKLS